MNCLRTTCLKESLSKSGEPVFILVRFTGSKNLSVSVWQVLEGFPWVFCYLVLTVLSVVPGAEGKV